MPTSEQIDRLREAGERLLEFAWDYEVDLRDEGLRGRIDEAEGGPWVPGPGSSRRLSARGFQAIREHYYDRFLPLVPVAHAFFESLTEAGAQGLLASRAGLDTLDPARRPSESVHHGPVPLPSAKTRSYDRFAESQGGTHVAGARLIWWCAASHRPWEFGYTVDLSWHAWLRVPWIQERGGLPSLADGPLEAIRDGVAYLLGLVADGGQFGVADPAAPDDPQPGTVASKLLDGHVEASGKQPGPPSRRSWGLGQDSDRRWHLFERYGEGWVHRRLITFTRGPQGGMLLGLFREGGGVLTFKRAFGALYGEDMSASGYDPTLAEHYGIAKIGRLIKSAVSHLRKQLYDSMGSGRFELIDYEPDQARYRLLVPVGLAIEELHEQGDEANLATGRWQLLTED